MKKLFSGLLAMFLLSLFVMPSMSMAQYEEEGWDYGEDENFSNEDSSFEIEDGSVGSDPQKQLSWTSYLGGNMVYKSIQLMRVEQCVTPTKKGLMYKDNSCYKGDPKSTSSAKGYIKLGKKPRVDQVNSGEFGSRNNRTLIGIIAIVVIGTFIYVLFGLTVDGGGSGGGGEGSEGGGSGGGKTTVVKWYKNLFSGNNKKDDEVDSIGYIKLMSVVLFGLVFTMFALGGSSWEGAIDITLDGSNSVIFASILYLFAFLVTMVYFIFSANFALGGMIKIVDGGDTESGKITQELIGLIIKYLIMSSIIWLVVKYAIVFVGQIFA